MNSHIKKVIHEAAQKHGISDVAYVKHVQDVIDATWNNPEGAELRAQLFPDGKPTVSKFISTIAELAKKKRGEMQWKTPKELALKSCKKY